jgi:predicted transcriptional regulator
MARRSDADLSRRERQIMDVVYARGEASVSQVHQAIPDPPSYSSVRALMRILEEKRHLRHRSAGNKYAYLPTRSHHEASRSAVLRLLRTFFDSSAERAVAAMIEASDRPLTGEELDRLARLIEQTRKEGR